MVEYFSYEQYMTSKLMVSQLTSQITMVDTGKHNRVGMFAMK